MLKRKKKQQITKLNYFKRNLKERTPYLASKNSIHKTILYNTVIKRQFLPLRCAADISFKYKKCRHTSFNFMEHKMGLKHNLNNRGSVYNCQTHSVINSGIVFIVLFIFSHA